MTDSELDADELAAAFHRLPVEERMKFILAQSSAVREAGREALRSVLLINGGAAVALLGFLGAALSEEGLARLGVAMNWPLGSFAVGVFFASLGLAFRYLSEGETAQAFLKAGALRRARRHQHLAVTAGGVSVFAFLVGVTLVCKAFHQAFAA